MVFGWIEYEERQHLDELQAKFMALLVFATHRRQVTLSFFKRAAHDRQQRFSLEWLGQKRRRKLFTGCFALAAGAAHGDDGADRDSAGVARRSAPGRPAGAFENR
jgi:hypothetical protein